MIRKFNYTGRRRINHTDIEIILNGNGKNRSFEANLDIDSLNLPPDASVYIEPYRRHSFMRFHCGTVKNFQLPADTTLKDIPATDTVLFKVKIVDESGKHGRLLALASQLKPVLPDEAPEKRMSILHVELDADLKQQVWKVTFDGSIPVLHVNKQIQNRRELVKSDEFMSLVYPAIVKEVVSKILHDYPEYDENGDHWSSLWLQFTKRVLHTHDKPEMEEGNETELEEWIDSVVEAFCRKYLVRNRYEESNLGK